MGSSAANLEITCPWVYDSPDNTRWILTNAGPGGATAVSVEVATAHHSADLPELDLDDVLTGSSDRRVELGPVPAGQSLDLAVRGTIHWRHYPIEVLLSWTDGDGDHAEGRQVSAIETA
jgi:hypothetical protein